MGGDSFRINIQECSRSLYAFIAFRPTCFARRLVMRNLHETSTQRARQLSPDSKNNSRRITYGIGRVWGMPSLSPLSSLETKLFHSIAEMFFAFFSQKNSLSKTFLVECLRSGAASCIKRREFWREIHTPLWLLIGRIIFFFFTCENHPSLLWLARTNLRAKIYDIAFWWVFLIMYIINSNMPKPWKWYHFRAEILRVGYCREYLSRLTRFTE